MKEAAGEANKTVITIVLIAIVLGVGTLVVSNLMKNVQRRSCCLSKGGVWKKQFSQYKCYASCGWSEYGVYVCSPEITECNK